MKLTTQKRLAASILKCSEKRIVFDTDALESIAESITKEDIRQLIKEGVIVKTPVKGISRVRANRRLAQRRKGRQQGSGTRKGTRNARLPHKEAWMNKIRSQRKHLTELRETEVVSGSDYRDLYRKAKGGFFRSKRHINLYIDEHNMRRKD